MHIDGDTRRLFFSTLFQRKIDGVGGVAFGIAEEGVKNDGMIAKIDRKLDDDGACSARDRGGKMAHT